MMLRLCWFGKSLYGILHKTYESFSACPNSNYALREQVIQHLRIKRSQVISDVVSQEMSFAVSNHKLYSEMDYEFVFMLAFLQCGDSY